MNALGRAIGTPEDTGSRFSKTLTLTSAGRALTHVCRHDGWYAHVAGRVWIGG